MDYGHAINIPPASVYEIPPGHDAWVMGDDPWVTHGRRSMGDR
jgi:hypothetical protein